MIRGLWREAQTELGKLLKESMRSWLVRISFIVTGILALLIIGTNVINFLSSTQGFGPHGACLLWLPGLIWLYFGSDASIWLSYCTISTTLIIFVLKVRHIIPFRGVFIAFGAFIVLCGWTHFMDILTLWIPAYWAAGTLKSVTAVVSVVTAGTLPFHLPTIFQAIKRDYESKQAHQVLAREVENQHQSIASMAEELIRANQMQRNFVNVAGHEVRNSLQSIISYSEILYEEALSSAETKGYASKILGQAEHIHHLVDNLLDLEKMKSGHIEMKPEHLDINTLIKKIVNRFRQTSKHTFRLRLDTTLPGCTVDADKIDQVLTNLLGNAIKYDSSGEDIIINSCMEDGMIKICVEDHGIGIPAESLEEIFIPYNRLEKTHYIKGTGLGLSISRQIVQMHGGKIWAESVFGKWSRFCFNLKV